MPSSQEPLPVLHGPRVTLRPMRDDEAAGLAVRLATDEQTSSRMGVNPATIERWITHDDVSTYAVEHNSEVIGVITFEEIDDPDYMAASMDIGMFAGSTDRGLGSETLRVLATYLIDQRGHHRLTIDPAADNARAIRAYEKVGFRPIGIAREYERLDDGSWHDNLIMDLLAKELSRLPDNSAS